MEAFTAERFINHEFYAHIIFQIVVKCFVIMNYFDKGCLRIGVEGKFCVCEMVFRKLSDLFSGLSKIGLSITVEIEKEEKNKKVFGHE